MWAAAIGTNLLEDLAALLAEGLVAGRSGSLSSALFMKPKVVADVVRELGRQLGAQDLPLLSADVASSARSSTIAVQTSPKMKWQSRSFHSRWAEVISGLTISTQRAVPAFSALTACSIAKVAAEQATFMSKP